MTILTNGEVLHAFLQPLKDRLSHYSSIASVLSSPYLVDDVSGFDSLMSEVTNLISSGHDTITLTDAETHKLFTLQFSSPSSDIIDYSWCEANAQASSYQPIVSEKIGRIKKNLQDEIEIDGDWIVCSADGTTKKSLSDVASLAADMLTTYTMMNTTISSIITRGEVSVSNILSAIKAKVSGARGVAKTFLEDITDSAQSGTLLQVITTLKKYMNNNFISASPDGSWSFSESVVTKEWNAGFILSGLTNITQTIGAVVTALNAPIGLLLTGIGAVVSNVFSAISDKFNSSTLARVEDSEGRELATPPFVQQYIQYGSASYNIIGEMINGKGPCHFEFLGLDGHAWSYNNEDPNVLVTHDPICFELFPSTKGYIPTADLYALVNHFVSTDIVSHLDGTYPIHTITHKLLHAVDLEWLSAWYTDHLVEVHWDDLSDTDIDDAAGYCWETSEIMLALIYLSTLDAGDEIANYETDAINLAHPSIVRPNLTGWEAIFRVGFCNYSVGSDGTNVQKRDGPIHEGQTSFPWAVIATWSQRMNFGIQVLPVTTCMTKMEQLWHLDESQGQMGKHVIAPFMYTVSVRYPMHVLPPQYDRASLLTGIILTTATVVVATAAISIAAIKVNQWRAKSQALTQAKTEQAWAALCSDPTATNVNAYRKAALKQNTIGRIFGCSPISNKNYWGGGADPGSNDDSVQTVITLIHG